MAGKIPQYFLDELLARTDVVDVVGARVTLKKSGSNHMACCPFHDEKTPSFSVSQSKQFYHCFGCGANGNAIGFLMEYEGMHFLDAVETLADAQGMEVPRDASEANRTDATKPLYALMDEIRALYRRELRDSPEAIGYLKRRGLDGETARRYGIGWTGARDALTRAFPDRTDDLVKVGMLGTNDPGRPPYPRFRDRVMFPITDRRGRTIAFGGRTLDGTEPKYLNSPETPIFHKGQELYGLHEARRAVQDAGHVLVVEGYMDVVALAHAGVDNAVATLGTATNRAHSEALFKVVPNIVFCFDGDRAGRAAAWRALQATLPVLEDGRDAHFLFLPDGEDPDSHVRAHGADGFRALLADKVPIVDQLYAHLAQDVDLSGIGGLAQLAERAKPLVRTVPRGVYRELALRRLEALIGVPLADASRDAPGAAGPGGGPGGGPGRAPASGRPADTPPHGNDAVERGLTPMSRAVLLVLQHPSVVATVPPDALEFDPEQRGADVLGRLIGACELDPGVTTARLIERFRGTSDEAVVAMLAVRPWWPDGRELDAATAADEFAHCMRRLGERARASHAARVDPTHATGLMSVRRPR